MRKCWSASTLRDFLPLPWWEAREVQGNAWTFVSVPATLTTKFNNQIFKERFGGARPP
jgi:hypothetical protein